MCKVLGTLVTTPSKNDNSFLVMVAFSWETVLQGHCHENQREASRFRRKWYPVRCGGGALGSSSLPAMMPVHLLIPSL